MSALTTRKEVLAVLGRINVGIGSERHATAIEALAVALVARCYVEQGEDLERMTDRVIDALEMSTKALVRATVAEKEARRRPQ